MAKNARYFELERKGSFADQTGQVADAVNNLHGEMTEALAGKVDRKTYDAEIRTVREDVARKVDKETYDAGLAKVGEEGKKKVDRSTYDSDMKAVQRDLTGKADRSDVEALRTEVGKNVDQGRYDKDVASFKADVGTRLGTDQYNQDREADSRRFLARDGATEIIYELLDVIGTLATRLGDDDATKAVDKVRKYVERRLPLSVGSEEPKPKTTKRKAGK